MARLSRQAVFYSVFLSCLLTSGVLNAAPFSVANTTGTVQYCDIPAQGFSPSTAGDGGSGTPPATGPVLLTSFSIVFDTAVNSGNLYIFDAPYTGTPAGLAALSVGQQGLIGSSSSVSNGVWSFGAGLQLPNVTAGYYAYTDVAGVSCYRASGTNVYDGPTYHLYAAQPVPGLTSPYDSFPTEDLRFTASFDTAAVPPPPTSIPTLSEWGMIILSSLLGLGTILTLRRKRQ